MCIYIYENNNQFDFINKIYNKESSSDNFVEYFNFYENDNEFYLACINKDKITLSERINEDQIDKFSNDLDEINFTEFDYVEKSDSFLKNNNVLVDSDYILISDIEENNSSVDKGIVYYFKNNGEIEFVRDLNGIVEPPVSETGYKKFGLKMHIYNGSLFVLSENNSDESEGILFIFNQMDFSFRQRIQLSKNEYTLMSDNITFKSDKINKNVEIKFYEDKLILTGSTNVHILSKNSIITGNNDNLYYVQSRINSENIKNINIAVYDGNKIIEDNKLSLDRGEIILNNNKNEEVNNTNDPEVNNPTSNSKSIVNLNTDIIDVSIGSINFNTVAKVSPGKLKLDVAPTAAYSKKLGIANYLKYNDDPIIFREKLFEQEQWNNNTNSLLSKLISEYKIDPYKFYDLKSFGGNFYNNMINNGPLRESTNLEIATIHCKLFKWNANITNTNNSISKLNSIASNFGKNTDFKNQYNGDLWGLFVSYLCRSKTSGYNKLFEINTLLYTSLKVSVNNNVVDDDGNEKNISLIDNSKIDLITGLNRNRVMFYKLFLLFEINNIELNVCDINCIHSYEISKNAKFRNGWNISSAEPRMQICSFNTIEIEFPNNNSYDTGMDDLDNPFYCFPEVLNKKDINTEINTDLYTPGQKVRNIYTYRVVNVGSDYITSSSSIKNSVGIPNGGEFYFTNVPFLDNNIYNKKTNQYGSSSLDGSKWIGLSKLPLYEFKTTELLNISSISVVENNKNIVYLDVDFNPSGNKDVSLYLPDDNTESIADVTISRGPRKLIGKKCKCFINNSPVNFDNSIRLEMDDNFESGIYNITLNEFVYKNGFVLKSNNLRSGIFNFTKAPIIITQPQDAIGLLNKQLRVTIGVVDRSNLNFSWFKVDKPNDKFITKSKDLVLSNVRLEDQGQYYVNLSTNNGETTKSNIFNVKVSEFNISERLPNSLLLSDNVNKLIVKADGDKKENYKWYKNDSEITDPKNKFLFKNKNSFVSLRSNGSVVSWGGKKKGKFGGDSSKSQDDLSSNIIELESTDGAFAALKEDRTVVIWGHKSYGGINNSKQKGEDKELTNIVKIYSTTKAFTALKENGLIVSWGHRSYGGNSLDITNTLISENLRVSEVYFNDGAFAAVTTSGEVLIWGNRSQGGYASNEISSQFRNTGNNFKKIVKIFNNRRSFAALREDGSVICWGSKSQGGDTGIYNIEGQKVEDVSSLLASGVVEIYSTLKSFLAKKNDGSIVTWGDLHTGGYLDWKGDTKLRLPKSFNVNIKVKLTQSNGIDLLDFNPIDGDNLVIYRGVTYNLDVSDSSLSGLNLRLSENKTSGEYLQGITYVGNPGSTGSYIKILIDTVQPNQSKKPRYIYDSNNKKIFSRILVSDTIYTNYSVPGDNTNIIKQSPVKRIYSNDFSFIIHLEDGTVLGCGDRKNGAEINYPKNKKEN